MIVIIAGPSGSGKTTIGTQLAERLGWTYADADTFHTAAAIAKMHRGDPLTDADRWPWLHAIGAWMDQRIAAGQPAVVTCSALRRGYRDVLLTGRPQAQLVYLLETREMLAAHLSGRHGHFFPADLLDSQLAAQEVPQGEARVLTVTPHAGSPADTVTGILTRLWPGGPPVASPPASG
ncbi:MAG TPA: gluconokinase [Streptosporangiaceae bacterium]|nr:gluconokinase [Streptosporangiaceae bacterium]